MLYGLSFAWSVRHPEWQMPGLPFLLAAITMAFCAAIAIWSGRVAQAHAIREAAGE
jgi:hypothetical protein